jgi:hypothetical protein
LVGVPAGLGLGSGFWALATVASKTKRNKKIFLMRIVKVQFEKN